MRKGPDSTSPKHATTAEIDESIEFAKMAQRKQKGPASIAEPAFQSHISD
jgi:hypothetical protein